MAVKGDGGASKWKPPGGKREVDQEGDGGASKWKPPGSGGRSKSW